MNLGIHTRFLEPIWSLDVENVIKLDTIQGHGRQSLMFSHNSPTKFGQKSFISILHVPWDKCKNKIQKSAMSIFFP